MINKAVGYTLFPFYEHSEGNNLYRWMMNELHGKFYDVSREYLYEIIMKMSWITIVVYKAVTKILKYQKLTALRVPMKSSTFLYPTYRK